MTLILLLACDARPDTGAYSPPDTGDSAADTASPYATDADAPQGDGLWLALPAHLEIQPEGTQFVPMRGRAEVLSVTCWGAETQLSLPAVVEGDALGELVVGAYVPSGAALPGCLVASTAGDRVIVLEWAP